MHATTMVETPFALLMLLRAEHQARVQRGETFALNVKAMADKETLAWTPGRFRNAIDVLLRAGYIKLVEGGHNTRRGRVAKQYTLVPRPLSALNCAPSPARSSD